MSSSSSSTLTLEQAQKRIAELEKENSKLKYRIDHLAKNLREELTAKADSEPAEAAGFNTRDLVLSSSNHFFGRVPLRNILEAKTPVGGGFIDKSLLVGGWVNNFRFSKKVAFIDLTDGSSVHSLQVVAGPDTVGWDKIETVSRGAAVMIRGLLIATPKADQPFELQASQIDILGTCDSTTYPMSKPMHSLEHLRTIAHMRPRYAPIAAVTRIRSALAFATHTFYQQQGFAYVHSPIITASDCEGAGEMFQVTTLIKTEGEHEHQRPTLPSGLTNYAQDFFEKPAYLTVSGQLNAEIFACSLSKVYTFGPTFRAEKSMTSRHLAEFWMIEPEVAFCDRDGCMDLAEHYVRHCIKYVLATCPEDMKLLDEGSKTFQTPTPGLVEAMRKLIAEPFGRCSYTEAIELLLKAVAGGRQFSAEVKWGLDLPTDMERYLAEEVFKKPVFVYNYPKDIKAFYMRLNDDGKTVAAYDLLVPGVGELVGGSQREERVDKLTNRLKELKLDVDAYWWYLDLRRFGTVPHAGFGLGFERLIMLCTGIKNIRDAIPFARFPGNADF